MRHERFDRVELRPAEMRVVQLLRLWRADDEAGAQLLLRDALGFTRARSCLRAFGDLAELLTRHGWHGPLILPQEAQGISDDERAIARFVLTATEQDRELALAEATMLVTPAHILTLTNAAERVGLPLLCEECRARLNCPLS
ncbi:hypothetical protein [Alloyangia pacifica]|uniref:Uncharacterized protein n=1 Tax=Alloyangia pacifica TaxID=311180 RepID=A0A1I6RY62_9RHOB|nr:hypothetical protein [Alloyangia pacifica]SDG66874.1 hypothetical protein SAMN04488245_1048 [Alloyangia pacifica]SFS69627.1 hypothetical protein SAMN04488050_1048 [Alloyangia pacifica]